MYCAMLNRNSCSCFTGLKVLVASNSVQEVHTGGLGASMVGSWKLEGSVFVTCGPQFELSVGV